MVITLLRSYPKLEDGKRKLDSKGQPITVFVYKVTGDKAEVEHYVQIQTDAKVNTIVDEDKTVLWFTTNPVGKKGTLRISTNNKVYADTTAVDLAQAMIRQHPGQLGTMLAKEILNEGFISDTTAEIPADEPIDSLN